MLTLPVELDVVWSEKLRPLRLLNVLYVIQRCMPFVDTIGIILAGKVIYRMLDNILLNEVTYSARCETYTTEDVSYFMFTTSGYTCSCSFKMAVCLICLPLEQGYPQKKVLVE